MQPIEKQIPNLLTIGNLFCGFLAIIACLSGDLVMAGWLVFIAAIFDLLDGMAAKLLNATSAIGSELDSLADIVSFGVVPALIAYMLLVKSHATWLDLAYINEVPVLALISFLLVACGAYRLARYNISGIRRQESGVRNEVNSGQRAVDSNMSLASNTGTGNFTGLPIPANAMFFASLPLILQYDVFVVKFDIFYMSQIILNPYFLTGCILLFSWLMVSKMQLFSLKISGLKGPNSRIIILFLIISALLFAFLLWVAVPLIIFLYIVFSYFIKTSPNEIQSTD